MTATRNPPLCQTRIPEVWLIEVEQATVTQYTQPDVRAIAVRRPWHVASLSAPTSGASSPRHRRYLWVASMDWSRGLPREVYTSRSITSRTLGLEPTASSVRSASAAAQASVI